MVIRYVESLNEALHQLMKEDESIFIIGEDIVDPYGGAFKVTKGLSSLYSDRVLTTPISEASITGFSIGMAIRGFRPIVEIMFGDFITLCMDQIVNGAAKYYWMYNEQVDVPIVIRTPMGGRRGYGPTHSQTLETLFLNVPGLSIVAPSCFHDPGKLLYQTVLLTRNPVLFVENKTLYPNYLKQPDNNGRIGDFYAKVITMHNKDYPSISLSMEKIESPDITLIAYGGMASIAAEAAVNLYMRDEIIVEIIIPSLIKPLPLQDVLMSASQSGKIVIAEESVRTSGWGAELASQITESIFNKLTCPVVRVGAKGTPIPSSKHLEAQVLPQAADIEAAIYNLVEV